jgi:catecholate siderophore receptor
MRGRAVMLWVAFAVLMAPAANALAQVVTGTLRGEVVDPMQAPIAGAEVTVAGGPAPTVVRTNAEGRFELRLPPGTYSVAVIAPGFAPATTTVVLRQDDTGSSRIILPVAGLRENVTVSAPLGYRVPVISSATKTTTPLRDVPQSVTVVTDALIKDQLMSSVADVMRYVPGVTTHQGENNRDQVIIRGNNSSADFFVNGVRDDVQYFRDLYNLDRVEAIKGPNALTFGRGGAGGVINRVVKEAHQQAGRELLLQAGQYGNKRVTADVNQPFTSRLSFRLNGMLEDSESFRDNVATERGAFNPTFTFQASDRTRVTGSYEYLRDRRVADRGITSYHGRPADIPIETYFGDAARSHVRVDVHLATAGVEHRVGRALFRNRLQVADYGRFYQNFVPGAANADASHVTLTAYNNRTDRTNVFNQTDVTVSAATGGIEHTFLAGTEFGRQVTDNFRQTGFFNDTVTAVQVPFSAPQTTLPVTFRPNATDANNNLHTMVAAAFVQDQVRLSRFVQVLGGVRFDRFDLRYHNNRNGDTLDRPDNLVSPRAGVVIKPIDPVSLYGSYSVSYLPSSGDQFSSLTTVTQQVEPEKFANYEVGVKWDAPAGVAVTGAVYRLDRTNTRSTDPNDPARIVQTGSQRTNGFEAGIAGSITSRWTTAGGYAYQDAYVRTATAAARAGAAVAQVPHHMLSLWNTVQLHPRLSAGLGIVQRSDVFAAIDNTVVLPGYVKADAAAYFTLSRQARLQINVENLTDKVYYHNADNNTNISPGYPRAFRVALITRF